MNIVQLIFLGAYLILACRNIDKANNLKKALLQKYQIKVYVKELDLNSFQSILKFTDEIDRQFECIFALVNNAGVFYHPQKLTKDNFDVTLQTNYLGTYEYLKLNNLNLIFKVLLF